MKLRWLYLGDAIRRPRAGAIRFGDGWRVLQMEVEVVEDAGPDAWSIVRVWRDVDEVVEPVPRKRK